ncbi:hypothetical protein IJ103_01800 [Candidatus Saccharibacteria bacterium]|nr:hypothetical protein [Candidatus Saccharibacteria bacterium]
MDIPDATALKRKTFEEHIAQGTLFRLRGEKPFESLDYHVFIVLNADWENGELLYLENGTSKIEKRKQTLLAMGLNPEEVSVEIPANKYSFFTKDTLIDCHDISSISLEQIDFSGNDFIYLDDSLSEDDLSKILRAINASPEISPAIKRKLGLK